MPHCILSVWQSVMVVLLMSTTTLMIFTTFRHTAGFRFLQSDIALKKNCDFSICKIIINFILLLFQVMVEDSKADSAGGGTAAGAGGGKEKAKVCRIREFLVKWQGKSYWKCSWVTELRVSSAGSISMVTVCCFIIVFFTYTHVMRIHNVPS